MATFSIATGLGIWPLELDLVSTRTRSLEVERLEEGLGHEDGPGGRGVQQEPVLRRRGGKEGKGDRRKKG